VFVCFLWDNHIIRIERKCTTMNDDFEKKYLAVDEEKKLLETLKGDKFRILYITALATGMRKNELLNLTWDDINLEKGILCVKFKTKPRNMPLSQNVVDELKQLKAGQSKNDALVFKIYSSALDAHFKNTLNKAGLPNLKFHILRHTCIVRMLENNTPQKTISEVLGIKLDTLIKDYSYIIPLQK
jgi:integrase